jgi:predicted CopG family antitoxin
MEEEKTKKRFIVASIRRDVYEQLRKLSPGKSITDCIKDDLLPLLNQKSDLDKIKINLDNLNKQTQENEMYLNVIEDALVEMLGTKANTLITQNIQKQKIEMLRWDREVKQLEQTPKKDEAK